MGDTENRALAADLLTATSHLRRSLRHSWRGHQASEPLSGSQSELMAVVADDPDLTVNEAAARLHLAANTVSTVVSHLVRLGLLERGTDVDDARVTRLRLTRAGQARRAATRDYRQQLLTDALGRLSARDRTRLAEAISALQSVVDEVRVLGDDGRPGSTVVAAARDRAAPA